jgi:xyloglucan-specific exo-beta-1,4-glucanase
MNTLKKWLINLNMSGIITGIQLCLILSLFLMNDLNAQTYGNIAMGGGGFVSGVITNSAQKNLMYIRTDVGGAYRWDSISHVWIPLLDWVSSDQTGYLGVESIATDPVDPDNMYMSVGISYFNGGKSAILRSADQGRTFSITDVTSLFHVNGNGMGRNTGEKLVVDPNQDSILFCGSRSNGLFKSSDMGAGWSHVSSLNVTTTSTGNGINFVVFDPSTGTSGSPTQTLIVGVSRTGSNMYRSDDGGTSFTEITGGPSTLMPLRASLSNDRMLYLTFANAVGPYDPNTGQIWKYNLASEAWTNITPAGVNTPFGGISVDPENSDRVVASTINVYQQQANPNGGYTYGDQIYLSTDGGASWVNKITHGYKFDPNGIPWAENGMAIHWAGCIQFDPFDTKRVHVISGNGLFTTDNIDSTTNVWKFNVRGLEETVPLDIISIVNGPVINVVGDYIGSRNFDPAEYGMGLTPGYGTYSGVAYAALKQELVVRTGTEFYLSTDTGKTWTIRTPKGTGGKVAISADGSVILHCPDNSVSTYRSVNNGTSWSPVSGLSITSAEPVADRVNPSVFYAYNSNGKMMVSLNGGVTFTTSGTVGSGASKHIRTVPGFEGHTWVALYGSGLSRSINYGTTFTKITSVTSCDAVGIGKALPGAAYPTVIIWGTVDGVNGLFFSTDEGASWNRANDGDHEWGGPANGQFVTGDMNRTGYVYMSTAGRGTVFAVPDYMLSASSLNIAVGDTTRINAITLINDTVSWTWTSNDTTIAEVDTTGLVTGIALGSVVITAHSDNGKNIMITIRVTVPVTGLFITPSVDSLDVGEQVQLTANVTPADAEVTWYSVNSAVASVSTSGLVTGNKAGLSIITATAGDKRVTIPVVVGILPSGISLTPSADTIKIEGTTQLSATILPEDASDKKVVWSSNKPTVAGVDTLGLVTGKSAGSAVITASSTDGSVKATCAITVTSDTAVWINPAPAPSSILIYPNPLNGKELSVDLGEWRGQVRIEILDLKGDHLFQQIETGKQQFTMDVNLKPGIYLIRFTNKQVIAVRKLVVN